MTRRSPGATQGPAPEAPGAYPSATDRLAELTAVLVQLDVLGVELDDIEVLARTVTIAAEDEGSCGSTTVKALLRDVARHPRAPAALLDALLRRRLVDPEAVRANPALALLSLRSFEELLAFPHLAPLLPLPRRTLQRFATRVLVRSQWQTPNLANEARGWIEHLEGLDDPASVVDALEMAVRASQPYALTVRGWLALATSADSVARATFIDWALEPRADDPPDQWKLGVMAYFEKGRGELAVATRVLLDLLPDEDAIERFGEGLAAYLHAQSEGWPPLFRACQRREIVPSLVRAICADGGLEAIGPKMMIVFAASLAKVRADDDCRPMLHRP